MTRNITVNLSAEEAHVLLAFLRNPDGCNPTIEPLHRPENPIALNPHAFHYLGPTLTAVRQRLEAAIAAEPSEVRYDNDDPHMAIVGR